MHSRKTINAIVTALAATTAISTSASIAGEEFYPGWESDTIKMMAFEGCMFDYGFDMQQQAKERKRYQESLSNNGIDIEMMVAFETKYPDWKDRYNSAIAGMTEPCHQAAKRIEPSIFRIDYTKGGKRGWKSQAVVDIAYKNCLESDPALTKAKIESLQLGAGANPYDMRNIELRERRTRGTPLAMDIPGSIKELGAGSDKCKKLLSGLSHNRKPNVQPRMTIAPSTASPEKNPHTQCLEAKDYEGCMRFNSDLKSNSSTEVDECYGKICVVKTRGKDVYGLPKPLDWRYLQADDGRLFYFSKVYRIPHKSEQHRYIGIQRITRYYQSPRSGTPGSLIGSSTANTNCVGSGASINCITTGTTPTYIPGESSTPGGVNSSAFDTVYDCKDNTSASYDNGKLSILGWRKNPDEWFWKYLRAICEKGESYRQGLDPLHIKM